MAAATYKVLGQVSPTGTSETVLYTVPAGTQAIVATLHVCNILGSPASLDVNVRPAGAAVANKHAFLRGTSYGAGSAQPITAGLTLAAGDVVSVKSSAANAFAVQAFGTEIA